MTALLSVVLVGMAAFSVDVGNWYLTGQEEQRAADAAALAGVPNLPLDPTTAFSTARSFAAANGFTNGNSTVSVTPSIDGQPTRLRVTVTKTVDNFFGPLLGVPKTTISRTAVADYAGPVPMGSPCNEFGNDPEPGNNKSANCADTGQFWANVGSPAATKISGDAYQDNNCGSNPDNCTGGINSDYDQRGYFYTVNVASDTTNLQLEAFDPALIAVGDLCDQNGLPGLPAAGTPADPRYAKGSGSPFCTGDVRYGGTGEVTTQFTVRQQVATSNPWDPMTYPVVPGCTTKFNGFNGDLSKTASYSAYLLSVFRKWVPLCTIADAKAGTYMIQVKTNGLGADAAAGHNRFALRAYSTATPAAKDQISVAGYQKMAMYANLPSAKTQFYLARVPSGAAGQVLNVRLYDVGDSPGNGNISILPPTGSGVTAFTNCKGTGPVSGTLPTCSIITNNTTFNGKWQTISVPIPANYTCNDLVQTQCWVQLQYYYGAGNGPSDTTSWSASIEGDPVRLVE